MKLGIAKLDKRAIVRFESRGRERRVPLTRKSKLSHESRVPNFVSGHSLSNFFLTRRKPCQLVLIDLFSYISRNIYNWENNSLVLYVTTVTNLAAETCLGRTCLRVVLCIVCIYHVLTVRVVRIVSELWEVRQTQISSRRSYIQSIPRRGASPDLPEDGRLRLLNECSTGVSYCDFGFWRFDAGLKNDSWWRFTSNLTFPCFHLRQALLVSALDVATATYLVGNKLHILLSPHRSVETETQILCFIRSTVPGTATTARLH
jgi:hypothetical protein